MKENNDFFKSFDDPSKNGSSFGKSFCSSDFLRGSTEKLFYAVREAYRQKRLSLLLSLSVTDCHAGYTTVSPGRSVHPAYRHDLHVAEPTRN